MGGSARGSRMSFGGFLIRVAVVSGGCWWFPADVAGFSGGDCERITGLWFWWVIFLFVFLFPIVGGDEVVGLGLWFWWLSRDGRFQVRGARDKRKKKLNTHSYSINKLSIKTNIQKLLFLNMKYYCFLIQSFIKRELNALSNLQNHLHYCILIQSSNPIPLRHYRHSKFIMHNTTNKNFS